LFCRLKIFFYICTPLRRKGNSEKDKEERFERLKRSKIASLFVFTTSGNRTLETAKNKKKKI
jgi:hypothetical protein